MNQLTPPPARIAADHSGCAAFAWQIECVGYVAAPANKQLGFVKLSLSNGMVIHGVRVFRTEEGLRIGSPEIARRYDPDARWTSSRCFNFPNADDWIKFSNEAIAAITRAFPAAIAHPDTTTTTKD